jgi:hypothetical protein
MKRLLILQQYNSTKADLSSQYWNSSWQRMEVSQQKEVKVSQEIIQGTG